MNDSRPNLVGMGQRARAASRQLATLSTEEKDTALLVIADELEARAETILGQNALDIEAGRAKGLDEAILDRLLLTRARVDKLAASIRSVVALPDPVGEVIDGRQLPNGLRLSRRRTPIGVLGVIYEARPNVTVDIASLALKTGNAVILRGGTETLQTNIALVNVVQDALEKASVPLDAVQYIENPDRALVTELLHLDAYVDMIIPRGGAGLHRLCRETSTIPVITGGLGICHLYVEPSADLDGALNVIENAKVQRPSVCNALDTLLVHRDLADSFLTRVATRLGKHRVELRAAGKAWDVLRDSEDAVVVEAGPDDFDQEWLSLILGVKVVQDLAEAIAHIQAHSTFHSDGILSNDWDHIDRFVNEIDSAAVFVNTSTRFNDGGEFGLGAEVAISTQKLHARGPMGLRELTTYKWIVYGDMHVRK
ncbi:MAG: glutamate-5-semialdehyde dehydrogenase [Anaerolineae bacterium]